MRWNLACTAGLVLVLASPVASGQPVAGQVLWSSGPVAAAYDGKAARPLAKGDPVHEGETITTGPQGYAQLLMSDQGLIALRPEASLQLKIYSYQGRDDGSERAVMHLMKGGLRSITGAVGAANKDNYQLRVKTVLVGIRGTDHETSLAPDGSVYNRVTLGGTYLQSAAGRVDIEPGQVAFAPLKALPALARATPEFMQLTKVAVPAGAPFNAGVIAHGKRTLPGHVTMPALPVQALGNEPSTKGLGSVPASGVADVGKPKKNK